MMRKVLLVVAALVLVALLAPPTAELAAAAYTVVLKDGRRFEAREKYVLEGAAVRFVGSDGRMYRFALSEVDLAATRRANPAEGSQPRKFVWTNDELERLRTSARINIIGPRRAEPPAAETAEGEAGEVVEEVEGEGEAPEPLLPREQDPESYRERLRPLRDQLVQVERQMADLQRNLRTGGRGAAAGGVNLRASSTGINPRDTLQQLQRRRDALRRQIAAIEDEARRNGISPGQIR
ncbi:MAG: hypothetical protein ACE5H2_07665 [Terriglobia bacterium]